MPLTKGPALTVDPAIAAVTPYMQAPPIPATAPGPQMRAALTWLAGLLQQLEQCIVPDGLEQLTAMQAQIDAFAVRVSLVGQVKAGKTALANCLIGHPELLPSDVNPWTSVVTSVHINTQKPRDHRAVFSFFSQSEWDNMVNIGGRLGEIAQRAAFDAEFTQVQAQITALQAATEKRLGRNFKYLLGSSHNFSGFSADLIKRYVCLGDDDATAEGRFADMTKSADLFIDDPQYPLPLVIRDTPGVNDPFLVRETVTLENLSQSDLCVIVLSAHQTFTSVDVVLIRILLALDHQQIILFVNRIDELDDPAAQIVQIDAHIRDTLADQGLPRDLPVIFGSALWANAQIAGPDAQTLGPSVARLQKLASDRLAQSGIAISAGLHKTQDLSGLGELQRMIDARSVSAVGAPFVTMLRQRALNLCQQSQVLMQQSLQDISPITPDLDPAALNDAMQALAQKANAACLRAHKECSDKIAFDMSAAYREFIFAETRALNGLLDRGGKISDWAPQTDGLRRNLNAAYREFNTTGLAAVQALFTAAATEVAALYAAVLRDQNQVFAVKPPRAQPARIPTGLMRSLSIDVTSGWLDTWFTTKVNKTAFAKRLSAIVAEDMKATIKQMHAAYVDTFIAAARQQLDDFLNGHFQTLVNLAALDADQDRAEMRRKLGLDAEINKRLAALAQITAALHQGPDPMSSFGAGQ